MKIAFYDAGYEAECDDVATQPWRRNRFVPNHVQLGFNREMPFSPLKERDLNKTSLAAKTAWIQPQSPLVSQ